MSVGGERPIIFSPPMVRAILDGRKTQTRRVIKPEWLSAGLRAEMSGPRWRRLTCASAGADIMLPYAVGDTLWVREAGMWRDGVVAYAATDPLPRGQRWRPAIHMPRWASRITLRVTDVRVQRLKDISEDDARAEGVQGVGCVNERGAGCHICVEDFARLWDVLHGPGAWDTNPWVVALTFNREVRKP